MKAISGYFIISIMLGSLMLLGGVILYLNYSYGAETLKEILRSDSRDANLYDDSDLPVCNTSTATNCRIVEGVTGVGSSEKKSGAGFIQNVLKPDIKCKGNGTVMLSSPMKIQDIGVITPMGATIGAHVTPIDHMYFSPVDFNSQPDAYEVYANADGIIDGIGVEPSFAENKHMKIRMTIRHTCDFYSIYNLLTSLSPRIQEITGTLGPGQYYQKPIEIKEGELLGKIGGQTLDLSVNYDKVILKGFIVPEHYEGESWKIHTVDPFDYFKEPYKSQLLAKNVRQVEPRGGKIDYDIDGRLVGNWFKENTGGYSGGGGGFDYWKNHVAFVYDHIDPTHIIISLGNYEDIARSSGQSGMISLQYGVKDNSPNPKDVRVASGPVKYDLVPTDYVLGNGQPWNRISYDSGIRATRGSEVYGVVVVELTSDRKLKLEIFPGKTASEVTGFINPVTYER